MGNRIGLAAVGVFLALSGLFALWARDAHPDRLIFDTTFINGWAQALIALLLVIVALTAIRWVAFTLAERRYGARHGTGTAMLGVALQGLDGIDKLAVRVVPDKRTRIRIRCRPSAQLGDVARRLDDQAVARVRSVLGSGSTLPVVVYLHVTRL
ncbi:hypothetical protein Acor_40190 [Acrocarpospora corrugata]|uniref:Uncharacterized protein n=1 Tax=Acrocarpospora corrugata TaxID=35763 RepID=A0A5M3VZS6_9ACTN|nr:hypothetical protein [Acrocarpospora corrugata]GES01954.1 hypothetical protein Acor_40190 [Acrocarpospora corrugata]